MRRHTLFERPGKWHVRRDRSPAPSLEQLCVRAQPDSVNNSESRNAGLVGQVHVKALFFGRFARTDQRSNVCFRLRRRTSPAGRFSLRRSQARLGSDVFIILYYIFNNVCPGNTCMFALTREAKRRRGRVDRSPAPGGHWCEFRRPMHRTRFVLPNCLTFFRCHVPF